MLAAGYPALVGGHDYVTGYRRVKLADPEGNRMMIAARHGWLDEAECGKARRSPVRGTFPG
jgi:hypothetical protein